MSVSRDIFAATNPALCGLVIWSFGTGFFDEAGKGFDFPLAILPVPIAQSSGFSSTFDGTNKNTGFLTWIERNPSLRVRVRQIIEETIQYSRLGLLFAIEAGSLELDADLSVVPVEGGLVKQPRQPVSTPVGGAVSRARRLGQWCGKLGKTHLVLNALGVEL